MSQTLKEFSLLSVFTLGQGNTLHSQEFITAARHAHTFDTRLQITRVQ